MPTSLYKSISAYLEQSISDIQNNGSLITDFHTGSVIRTMLEAVAAALSFQSSVADQLNFDSYLDTATGQGLDDLASNFEVTRLPAIQATGTITITRQATTGTLLIAAGWSTLSTVPVPNALPVGFVTTADANFPVGVATVSVPAMAVLGGTLGNVGSGTVLLPTVAINGVQSQTGFITGSAFDGGVDVETDDALRRRIPIVVQGRVNGTRMAYSSAALSTPGVIGANILQAGDTLGDSTRVPAGSVYIFYRGTAGILGSVQSACDNASVINQSDTAYASISLPAPRGAIRCVIAVNIYVIPGTDFSATGAAVSTALLNYFAALTVGQTAHYSDVVRLLHTIVQVISVGLPMPAFCKFTDPPGTAADIIPFADSYLNLTGSDITITIIELT